MFQVEVRLRVLNPLCRKRKARADQHARRPSASECCAYGNVAPNLGLEARRCGAGGWSEHHVQNEGVEVVDEGFRAVVEGLVRQRITCSTCGNHLRLSLVAYAATALSRVPCRCSKLLD